MWHRIFGNECGTNVTFYIAWTYIFQKYDISIILQI